ncbi:MAG: hypothetical protein ACFFD4_05055 [Candidatus Odinarchaeota archaeon]
MKQVMSRKKKTVHRKKANQARVLLFLVLVAALFGGITQLFRYQAVMADSVKSGISFASSIPSNTDASREGRSYQANVSYTGAAGLQAKFTIVNEGSSNYTAVTFLITAPSLMTLDDEITLSDPTLSDTTVKYTERSTGDTLEFEIKKFNVGNSLEITFYFDTTGITVSSAQELDFNYLVTGVTEGSGDPIVLVDVIHPIQLLPPPTDRIIAIFLITAAIFFALVYLSWSGAFNFYSTEDLIMIAIIGAIQTVYVQIIGRQFVFPVVDRVPGGYFFAIGDLPYIFLLVAAVAITRKPGTVSLTLFIYNITSEIGWYGLNPLWWMYPFAQGLAADIYVLIRGRGIFTSEMTWLNWSTPKEETGEKVKAVEVSEKLDIDEDLFLEDDMVITELKTKDILTRKGIGIPGILDGAAIGFFRGFFMQLSLYLVFYPNLFHVYFSVGYFSIIVFTWAVGNAIAGAISVPVARVVEEALSF